jgi:hypothetical protein
MIWRRVLVPVAWTLEELHGVIQAAMGWEGRTRPATAAKPLVDAFRSV